MPVVPKGNPNKHRLNTNGSVVDGDDELEVSNVSPPDVEIELARDDPSSPRTSERITATPQNARRR